MVEIRCVVSSYICMSKFCMKYLQKKKLNFSGAQVYSNSDSFLFRFDLQLFSSFLLLLLVRRIYWITPNQHLTKPILTNSYAIDWINYMCDVDMCTEILLQHRTGFLYFIHRFESTHNVVCGRIAILLNCSDSSFIVIKLLFSMPFLFSHW